MKESARPEIIRGHRTGRIRFKLKFTIFRIAVRTCGNPITAYLLVKKLKRIRREVHGNTKITKFVRRGPSYFWASDYPGFPSKAFKVSIRSELARALKRNTAVASLQTVIWGVTNRCPLQCRHCCEWDRLDTKDHLSIEDLKLILNKIRDQNIFHVQLSGGEPMLRFKELTELISSSGKDIQFWLLTSGYGFSLHKAQVLKEAGLSGVNISLDHWNEKTHNSFRNNDNSYRWAREAAEYCLLEGLLVSLSLCATQEIISKENLWKYAEIAKDWGVHFIRLLEVRKLGRFANNEALLNEKEIGVLEDFYLEYQQLTRQTDHPILIYPGYHQRKLGCFGAGNRYLYIDPNAGFHACPFCIQEHGNALTTSFEDAIRSIKERKCHSYDSISAD